MLGVWERHPLLALFAGNALVLVALLPPTVYSSDGANMMRVAESLATSGDFDVPCGDQAIPGRGGRCFSTFYPLLSVVAAPFILAGRAISSPVGVPPEFGGPLVALLVSALAAAGADDDRRRRVAVRRPRPAGVFAGAAFAFGTEALTYARILRRDAGLVLHHPRAVGRHADGHDGLAFRALLHRERRAWAERLGALLGSRRRTADRCVGSAARQVEAAADTASRPSLSRRRQREAPRWVASR